MVLYSAVSSPLDRSKRFTLSSPGRPVHSDTVLGFSWKHSSHAAIAQRLFTHISTTVYSQVSIISRWPLGITAIRHLLWPGFHFVYIMCPLWPSVHYVSIAQRLFTHISTTVYSQVSIISRWPLGITAIRHLLWPGFHFVYIMCPLWPSVHYVSIMCPLWSGGHSFSFTSLFI